VEVKRSIAGNFIYYESVSKQGLTSEWTHKRSFPR